MYTHKLLLYFGCIRFCHCLIHFDPNAIQLPIVRTLVYFIYFLCGVVPRYLRIFGNGTNSFHRYFQNLSVFGTIPTGDIFIDSILQEQVKLT